MVGRNSLLEKQEGSENVAVEAVKMVKMVTVVEEDYRMESSL